VLGQLRARLRPRLEAAGVRVEWRVGDLKRIDDLGPHMVLPILRILHETVVGVLDGAARTITVRTGEGETPAGQPGVFVEIAGDGGGAAWGRAAGCARARGGGGRAGPTPARRAPRAPPAGRPAGGRAPGPPPPTRRRRRRPAAPGPPPRPNRRPPGLRSRRVW